MSRRPHHIDVGAGWLMVALGLLHSALTMRRSAARIPVPQAGLLVSSGILLTFVGASHLASLRATADVSADTPPSAASIAASFGSLSGVMLALVLLWRAPGMPQALPLLMVFGIATVITMSPRR